MELLQVNDFGKSGLNTDLPAWDLPLSYLTYAQNFRIFNNKILGFGGTKKLSDLPAGFNADHILYSPTASEDYWILAGDKIYVYDGTTFTELSATLPAYGVAPNGWTSCHLGRVPILNNSSYYPLYWNPKTLAQDMQVLPYDALGQTWVDVGWSCRAMRSFGPYLVAMNMKEGVIEYNDTVRWSHPAERNDVPATWDETDPASLAGINNLGGDGGDIVDGLTLRNSFVIYRNFGINVLEYSNDSYVFNNTVLTNTINIANINCIKEVKGVHFILATNDIVINTGDTVKSILHQRARIRYAAIINEAAIDRAFMVHNTTTKEVWCFLPTADNAYPSEVWIYNYRDDTWSMHDVDLPAHADYGRVEVSIRVWGDGTGDPSTYWGETWETATGNWARSGSAFDNNVIGVKVDTVSTINQMDQFTSETDYTTVLERTDYTLTTMQDVNTITRVYPHVKGTRPILFQVGSQDHAGGPVRWRPQVSFTPGTDRKIDVLTTGELFSFKITAPTNSNFAFSGMDIEYEKAGLR